MITFQYRLYPTKEQQVKLWQHANKLNWLYNYFLNQRIENYKNGIKIDRKEQQAELISLKASDTVLDEIHSQVLQQVPLRLDRSYQSFFRRVKAKEASGFPKFRSCQNFFGICYPQSGFKIENGIFQTKVYGQMSFVQHRDLKGQIKQVSVSNKNNGKVYDRDENAANNVFCLGQAMMDQPSYIGSMTIQEAIAFRR